MQCARASLGCSCRRRCLHICVARRAHIFKSLHKVTLVSSPGKCFERTRTTWKHESTTTLDAMFCTLESFCSVIPSGSSSLSTSVPQAVRIRRLPQLGIKQRLGESSDGQKDTDTLRWKRGEIEFGQKKGGNAFAPFLLRPRRAREDC